MKMPKDPSRVRLTSDERWVVPEHARVPGATHTFTEDGAYVGPASPIPSAPVGRGGCPVCAHSGICGCVIAGPKVVC